VSAGRPLIEVLAERHLPECPQSRPLPDDACYCAALRACEARQGEFWSGLADAAIAHVRDEERDAADAEWQRTRETIRGACHTRGAGRARRPRA
jgi:hypothetical protein